MFVCVVVTKRAQFDQIDWPRTLRGQVSIYNNYRMYFEITEPRSHTCKKQGFIAMNCQKLRTLHIPACILLGYLEVKKKRVII